MMSVIEESVDGENRIHNLGGNLHVRRQTKGSCG